MKKILLFALAFLLIYFGLKLSNSNNLSPNTNPNKSPKVAPTDFSNLTITRVIDGDTAVLSTDQHVRFLGENSPEHDEGFFQAAKDLNSSLDLNKQVHLEYESEKTDRYGRVLAFVFVNNDLINAEIVKAGLAVEDFMQPNEKYASEILTAENYAKEHCLGMWAKECQNPCIKIAHIETGDFSKDKNSQYIEIENDCSSSINLSNWMLKDTSSSNRYHFKNISLDSNTKIDLFSGCGNDSSTQIFWSCPSPTYAIWNKGGDHAFLLDPDGYVIADVKY